MLESSPAEPKSISFYFPSTASSYAAYSNIEYFPLDSLSKRNLNTIIISSNTRRLQTKKKKW